VHLGDLVMPDRFRTALAKFTVEHLARPRPLVIRAWLWLAAKADDIEEKRRCLSAILELDLENEPATLVMVTPGQGRPPGPATPA